MTPDAAPTPSPFPSGSSDACSLQPPARCGPTRREFLESAVAAGAGVLAGPGLLSGTGPLKLERAAAGGEPPALPTARLGRTGRDVCRLALGTGQIADKRTFDEAVAIIAHALEAGITYIDTAPSYQSEEHVGRAIAGRRKGVFLATKTLERSYDGAMRELEGSLKRLGTDRLDLWQVHSIGHHGDGDKELAYLRDPDGVMKAMRKAKAERTVELIGFTGHTRPEYMLKVLDDRELEFDTMLFTISAALARRHQRGWEDEVLPAGRKRGLGLIAMKVFGGGAAVGEGGNRASPGELLRYVWDRGLHVANVGLYSRAQVDAAVAVARECAARLPPDQTLRKRFEGIELPFERPGYRDVFVAERGGDIEPVRGPTARPERAE